jgi:hypothetical protein
MVAIHVVNRLCRATETKEAIPLDIGNIIVDVTEQASWPVRQESRLAGSGERVRHSIRFIRS